MNLKIFEVIERRTGEKRIVKTTSLEWAKILVEVNDGWKEQDYTIKEEKE